MAAKLADAFGRPVVDKTVVSPSNSLSLSLFFSGDIASMVDRLDFLKRD